MTGDTAGPHSLSATLLEHIDAVCDRFEREWRAGERPLIEEYLAREAEPALSVLFHEMLVAELGGRRRLGESPGPSEYLGRFAAHASIVEAAFAGPSTTGHWGDSDSSGADSNGLEPTSPRFHILRPLAEGGLGVVSIAADRELHREVALKEIQPRLSSRPESRERFVREAEITGNLEHPGIVPVYSLGRYPDGRPYYAMRLIQGTSLKQAIADFHEASLVNDADTRVLGLRKLLNRFRDVCDALAYAHSRGVVHRDVKPQNIMVGQFGETLLVDWGLAKVAGKPDSILRAEAQPLPRVDAGRTDETAEGSAVGTPAYMSPEQAEGLAVRLGPASDVYGLGATLYHLLTGRPPFEGGAQDVVRQVQAGDFPKPRSLRRDIPRPLEAVCVKAMATSPDKRYRSANDLADDIENWLAGEPVTAWREPLHVQTLRWVKRQRTVVIAAVSAILLTALVFGGCVLLYCVEHAHVMWSTH